MPAYQNSHYFGAIKLLCVPFCDSYRNSITFNQFVLRDFDMSLRSSENLSLSTVIDQYSIAILHGNAKPFELS